MNKIFRHILSMMLLMASLSAIAQPAPVKKTAQSVCTITTFAADGSIKASTHGVFVGTKGEILAMWNIFEGASRATAIDALGKSHEVDVILGVSELYDLCKVRIKDKAPAGLTIASTDQAASKVYLIDYAVKKAPIKELKPERTEKFNTTLNYYVFQDIDVSNTDLGSPIVNESGQLVGIMQRPKNGGQAYSADVRLTNDFKLSGLSINDHSLRATGLRTALPDDEQQATLMLMVAGQGTDTLRYDAYVEDFIQSFPNSIEGYKARAGRYIAQANLSQADATFSQALKQAANKHEAYYEYASSVYRASVYRIDTTYTAWNLDKALDLAGEAVKLNALPVYKHLQAQILYAQRNYQDALNLFSQLADTEMGKNGEIYYEAAQCKTMLQAPAEEIIEQLDKAVAAQDGVNSAPYVLARARYLDNQGLYRKAFADYLKYDTLVNNRGTHDFYYDKFHCEMKIRQYQLALNDIAHAIVLNRMEPTYYAEMANLQLQVGKLDDAIVTCDLGLGIAPEYADLYIIKGVAQCENQQKAEGLATLAKANELGDDRAPELIEKYEKKKIEKKK